MPFTGYIPYAEKLFRDLGGDPESLLFQEVKTKQLGVFSDLVAQAYDLEPSQAAGVVEALEAKLGAFQVVHETAKLILEELKAAKGLVAAVEPEAELTSDAVVVRPRKKKGD